MEKWLENQRAYQESVYGVDYQRMWRSREVVDYVHTMLTAAGIEVAEAQQEVPWKPWAQLSDDERLYRLRDNSGKVIGELVDVLFFIGNALVAMGATDETLAKAYAAKMGVNRTRQATGYDGISTKCANCGRALDEPGVAPPVERNGVRYCGHICSIEDQGSVPETEVAR